MEAAAAIEQAPSRDYAAIAAALGTVAVWASAFVGIRSAGHSFSPGALSLGRLTVAVVALGAAALVRREPLPSRDALRQIVPRSLFSGVAVAFAGVVVIAIARSTRSATTNGVLLCFGAAAAYAAGVVTQKVVLRRLTPFQTVFACALIGVLVCTPFAPQLVRQLELRPLAHERGPARGDDVSRSPDLGAARLDVARRDAGVARLPRRRALPRGRSGV